MIDNYLDFVKGRRAHALAEARRCVVQSRSSIDEWTKGFYRGLCLGQDFESRHWRALQKDIEALNKRCHAVMDVDLLTSEKICNLSLAGGKNG